MIPEQSFDVTLDGWGEVTFVSCRPPSWQYEDTSFFLVRDEQILYKFPNSTKGDVEFILLRPGQKSERRISCRIRTISS